MTRKLNYIVAAEDGVFVARCIELDVVSDGLTEEEAVANLREALDRYFESPDALIIPD